MNSSNRSIHLVVWKQLQQLMWGAALDMAKRVAALHVVEVLMDVMDKVVWGAALDVVMCDEGRMRVLPWMW